MRIAVGVLSVGVAGVWSSAYLFLHPAQPPPSAIPALDPSPLVAEPAPHQKLPVFARGGGVALHLVSHRVVAVAYHEASFEDAMSLRPFGVCVVCRNRSKFDPPPLEAPELEYVVMDTRGRSSAATSAVDLVMPAGAVALAPVDGTVVGVKRYRLYYRHPDVRVEIRPDGAAHRRVVMIHLQQVKLEEGDRVEASVTPVGTVRGFPFESQVDRYVRGRLPHVHVEVKRRGPRGQAAAG